MKNYTFLFRKKYHAEIDDYLAVLHKLHVQELKNKNPKLLMFFFLAVTGGLFIALGYLLLSAIIAAGIAIFIKLTIWCFLTIAIKTKKKELEKKKKILQTAAMTVMLEFFDDLAKGLEEKLQICISQENFPRDYEWIKIDENAMIFKTNIDFHQPIFIANGVSLLGWTDTIYEGVSNDDMSWFYDTQDVHQFEIRIEKNDQKIEIFL